MPGPILSLTISETIRHGLRAGLRVSLAPLMTDGPIILFYWLVLSRFSDVGWFFGVIRVVGAVVLAFLAWECLSIKGVDFEESSAPERSLIKGVLTNLLNPAPYLFWGTVGTPALLQAHAIGLWASTGFLVAFFSVIILSKMGVALITARYRDFLRSRIYMIVMRVMGLTLLLFAVLFFKKALAYF